VAERAAPRGEEQARCEVLAEEAAPPLADFHSDAEAVPAESPADGPVAGVERSESPEAGSRASYSDYLAAAPEPSLADSRQGGAERAVRIGCYPAEQDDYSQAAWDGSPVRSVEAQRLDDCSPAHDCYPAGQDDYCQVAQDGSPARSV